MRRGWKDGRNGLLGDTDRSSQTEGSAMASVPNSFMTKDFKPSAFESPCPDKPLVSSAASSA